MIGVKLRCKLIPWAMLVGLGSVSRAPTREAIMPRALSSLGNGERKGGVVFLHNQTYTYPLGGFHGSGSLAGHKNTQPVV